MSEPAKDSTLRKHFNSCCESKFEADESPDYIDDSIALRGHCTECGTQYIYVYDLAYIEHTDTQTPVYGK